MGPHNMLGTDPATVRSAHVDRHLVRRVWGFARPYRPMLFAFLVTIVLEAFVGILPPLLIKRIIDTAIPQQDNGMVTTLALLMVAIALGDALLSLGERWWSAKIGEGLIFDLRVTLFDHVQRMPIAFFTRTQTGALISRMNNDVIGAQRALTGTLGSVVSNVIDARVHARRDAVPRVAAHAAHARAAAVLHHPGQAGRPPAAGDHPRGHGPQLRDEHHDDRAVQRGRRAAREAVRPSRRRGRRLLAAAPAGCATSACAARCTGVSSSSPSRLVGAVGTAAVYLVGGQLVISGAITLGTLVALAAYVTRIYGPLTASPTPASTS